MCSSYKSSITMRVIYCVILLCSIVCINTAPVDDHGFEFILLHNNDIHARFEETDRNSNKCTQLDKEQKNCYGGFARTAHVIRKYREDAKGPEGIPVIYLNAGDTYAGTVWFTICKDKIASKMMNILSPDVMTLGNHEFDKGVKGLIPFLNSVNFPVVTANLGLENVPKLKEVSSLANSTVLSIEKGTKIGVVGYLTTDTARLASVGEVKIYPEINYVNEEAKKLRNAGVDIIIALGHSGFERDKEIAGSCPDVDLVVGGHTNTFLYNGEAPDIEIPEGPYPFVVEQPSGKKVPVLQAYAYTKYLGHIQLRFDQTGKLKQWTGNPILLDSSIPQDEDVLKSLDEFRPLISNTEDTVVGKINVDLDGTRDSCRKGECNMGNLMADSMVYARQKELIKSHRKQQHDAVIAFVQSGGIRASIEKKADGAITYNDILNVLPFNNTLYVIPVSGSTIQSALELSAENYHRSDLNGGFLQMSGVKVTYAMSKPLGQRVKHVFVRTDGCGKIRYVPLDKSKTYKIILPSFLLDGGDGHRWTNASNAFEKAESMEITDYQAVVNYVKDNSPIDTQKTSRIVII